MREQDGQVCWIKVRVTGIFRARLQKVAWFLGAGDASAGLPTATDIPWDTVIAQGRKRIDLGRTTFTYGESRYLLTSLDLPVVSQITEAMKRRPVSRCL